MTNTIGFRNCTAVPTHHSNSHVERIMWSPKRSYYLSILSVTLQETRNWRESYVSRSRYESIFQEANMKVTLLRVDIKVICLGTNMKITFLRSDMKVIFLGVDIKL
jgi:hypothetical protein